MDKQFDGAPYAGKRVVVKVDDPVGRNLKCEVGAQFEGVVSDKPDPVHGFHYVVLSDADAEVVGEPILMLGYTASIVKEPNV